MPWWWVLIPNEPVLNSINICDVIFGEPYMIPCKIVIIRIAVETLRWNWAVSHVDHWYTHDAYSHSQILKISRSTVLENVTRTTAVNDCEKALRKKKQFNAIIAVSRALARVPFVYTKIKRENKCSVQKCVRSFLAHSQRTRTRATQFSYYVWPNLFNNNFRVTNFVSTKKQKNLKKKKKLRRTNGVGRSYHVRLCVRSSVNPVGYQ